MPEPRPPSLTGELTGELAERGEFDQLSEAELRRRLSTKWRTFPLDVLPAFVAELDVPFAPAIREALAQAVADGDGGYGLVEPAATTFAAFARRRWDWPVDPDRIFVVPDVLAGMALALDAFTEPGDAVVYPPPVYPPFRRTIERLGRVPAPVLMLRRGQGGWCLDLDLLAERLAAGARAVLLCHPHNPLGVLAHREELTAVRELAARYGAFVVSDEVHAPLTLPGATFLPYLGLGDAPAVAVTSAGKGWNIAGLKCALVVAGDDATAARLRRLPDDVVANGSHFGVLASAAAFGESVDWLDRLVEHLDRQRRRLEALLRAALPSVGYRPPDAGYLAWLDCRALGLGDDPADVFLRRGRVALSPGPTFGAEGLGHVRLNMGTTGPLLAEIVARMARACE